MMALGRCPLKLDHQLELEELEALINGNSFGMNGDCPCTEL
jgi:hypothetical protein